MVLVLMGVAGAGKTTVGQRLAHELGWQFVDADAFHSPESIERMGRGEPLDDAARDPWIERLRAQLVDWLARGRDVVLACSALRAHHRARLAADDQVRFVHLTAPEPVLRARLAARSHFAGPALLESQLASLEPPAVPSVDTDRPVDEVVAAVRALIEAR